MIPHQLSSRVWVLPYLLDPNADWLRNYILGLGSKNEQECIRFVIFSGALYDYIFIYFTYPFSLYILSFVFIVSCFVLVLFSSQKFFLHVINNTVYIFMKYKDPVKSTHLLNLSASINTLGFSPSVSLSVSYCVSWVWCLLPGYRWRQEAEFWTGTTQDPTTSTAILALASTDSEIL